MRCFIVGVLGLGLVAPASAARHKVREGNFERDSVDQGVWLTEVCQTEYDDSIGLLVGDVVRLYRLMEDGTAKPMHNKAGIVKCPSPDLPGRVCLEGMGCWEAAELKKLSAASAALVRLSAISVKFAGTVVAKAKDSAKLAGASVQEALPPLADMIMTKIDKKAKLLWKRVNPCSKEVQAKLAEDLANVKMQVSRLAHSTWNSTQTHWPVVRAKLEHVTRSTVAAIAMFSMLFYDQSLKPKVDELTAKLTIELDIISAAMREKMQEARETRLAKALETFTQDVAKLAGLLASRSSKVYHSARVQALLSTLQDGAGELLACAATGSEALRAKVNQMAGDLVNNMADLALEARDQVRAMGPLVAEVKAKGKEAVAAVNPCDQAVREKAANTVKKAFTYVVAQVQTLDTAIKDRWPAVKESILLTAETMQGYAEDIAESAKDKAEKAWSSPKVQWLVTQIEHWIESLRALAEKPLADVTEKVQDITAKIQSLIGQLTKETEAEEKTMLDAVADF